jgi:hypothetical protein
MFWALALYFIVVLLTTKNKKYWLYFGAAAGLGMMSKFDIAWLGVGVAGALMLTSQSKNFLCWQLWIGGVIAFIIFSPYLVWIAWHFPLVWEYYSTYASQTLPISITQRMIQQIFGLNPLSSPIWIIGLAWFLFGKYGKNFRMIGIAYFIVVGICAVLHTKFYLCLPYYNVLFVGGAVVIEVFSRRIPKIKYVTIFYTILIIMTGLLIVPLVRPMLPINLYVKYQEITNNILPDMREQKKFRAGKRWLLNLEGYVIHCLRKIEKMLLLLSGIMGRLEQLIFIEINTIFLR